MKTGLNKFLLGTLWILSLLLAATFWFDMQFDFNIFARAHWRYLANIQTGPGSITTSFYASLIILTLALPLGLYLIARPNRRIRMATHKTPAAPEPVRQTLTVPTPTPTQSTPAPTLPPTTPTATAAAHARPPQMNIPINLRAVDTQVEERRAKSEGKNNSELKPNNQPALSDLRSSTSLKPSAESVEKIKEILTGAGYVIKNQPTIDGLRPDIWALGSDEILLVGAICPARGNITAAEGGKSKWQSSEDGEFESPAGRLSGAVSKLRALFDETLDEEIKITVRAFVIMDGGRIENRDAVDAIWKGLDVEVFDSPAAFENFMSGYRNRELTESEREDFDAYAEYIDTVREYFDSK